MIRTVNDLLNELKGKDPVMPIGEALSLCAKMDIYELYQRECDEQDCIGFLIERDYEAATKDKDFMDEFITRYRHKFDCEYGTWDNIAATMFYFKEDLDKYTAAGGANENKGGDCM